MRETIHHLGLQTGGSDWRCLMNAQHLISLFRILSDSTIMDHLSRKSLLALAFLASLILSVLAVTGDHEHAKALKDFVPDHPHLHELVDKTHQGDKDAKHLFEKQSLSVRFNKTKASLPPTTDEEHVVLHFLDDYTAHVSGNSDHQFMALEPFINMLSQQDDLKKKLHELGQLLEKAECDFNCLGAHLTAFMNEAMDRLMAHTEL